MHQPRIAVIGCGQIGGTYCRVFRDIGARVLATADPQIARAEAAAAGFDARAFADHWELLQSVEVDLACVCSPTPYHHRTALDVIAAGRHLFLEKAMAETLPQAEEVMAAAHAAGITVGFGFKMRFETIFATARRLVREGAIGTPQEILISQFQPEPVGEKAWFVEVGLLPELLIHAFDLAGWWLDARPEAVRATSEHRLGRAGEDRALVELIYSGERRATVLGGYIPGYPAIGGGPDMVFQIVGDGGYLVGRRPDRLSAVTRDGIQEFAIQPVDAFEAELIAFLNALAHGRPVPVPGEAGLLAQAIIATARASADSGRREPIAFVTE